MKPELLSPAGSPAALEAAVAAGADAVYFGAQSFNARKNASNFNDEELKNAVVSFYGKAPTPRVLNAVVDAYVDAQLSNFDISEDIHLSIEPQIIDSRQMYGKDYYGFNCNISF